MWRCCGRPPRNVLRRKADLPPHRRAHHAGYGLGMTTSPPARNCRDGETGQFRRARKRVYALRDRPPELKQYAGSRVGAATNRVSEVCDQDPAFEGRVSGPHRPGLWDVRLGPWCGTAVVASAVITRGVLCGTARSSACRRERCRHARSGVTLVVSVLAGHPRFPVVHCFDAIASPLSYVKRRFRGPRGRRRPCRRAWPGRSRRRVSV